MGPHTEQDTLEEDPLASVPPCPFSLKLLGILRILLYFSCGVWTRETGPIRILTA